MMSEEDRARLWKLRVSDVDACFEECMALLVQFEDQAVTSDENTLEEKICGITTLEEHYKTKEDYERCSFLMKLKKRIVDAANGEADPA